MVLKIYRQHGLLTKPKPLDWAAFALMAAYREVLDMAEANKHLSLSGTELASWLTDPLLLILLIACTPLYRSNQRMGPGAIGRCWNAFAVGVALVCIGLVALWAGRWGYLPWPYSSLFWYVWLPADTAFALAPIYQLEAIEQASIPSRAGAAS